MGICAAGHTEKGGETATSKNIDASLVNRQKQELRRVKLLLLGAGESGKSTLFKQMIMLYGKGYSQNDRVEFFSVIHTQVVLAAQTLAAYGSNYGQLGAEALKAQAFLDAFRGELRVTPEVAGHIDKLWKDPVIQKAFNFRGQHFQLFDSANYFFNKVFELTKENWIPSYDDILLVRARTTGLLKTEFVIDGVTFLMFDVGGQRNERKKWMSLFDNVTAVVFVAAVSEYDQLCFEDEKTNRMDEALNLFTEICNSDHFIATSMILFLNKRDLFAIKIKTVPLKVCFKEYMGSNDMNESLNYIREKFLEKNLRKDKVIYTHVTCATDQNNVRAVFMAVKDIIMRNSLSQAGLID
jgi:GTPase SAR1 family protein